MTPQEALRRQAQLERLGRTQPSAVSVERDDMGITSRTPEALPVYESRPQENSSLSIIQSSMPSAYTKEVPMPSATTRPMVEETMGVTATMPSEGTVMPSANIPDNDVSQTLDMIRASKLYDSPTIKKQVDQMEEKYSPVQDYLNKKKGAR